MRAHMRAQLAQPHLADAWGDNHAQGLARASTKPTAPPEPRRPANADKVVRELFETPPRATVRALASAPKRARVGTPSPGSFKRSKASRGGKRSAKPPSDSLPPAPPSRDLKKFPDAPSRIAFLRELGVPEELLPDVGPWGKRGAHSYTKTHANGASVEILVRNRAFFNRKSKGGVPATAPRTFGWNAAGGIAHAWRTARESLVWE